MADIIPSGIPVNVPNVHAAMASCKVAPHLSISVFVTGRCVWTLLPRSPRSTLPSHEKYWTTRGLSSPHFSRSASRVSGAMNPLSAVTTITVQIVALLTGDQEFDSAKTLSAFALGLLLFVCTLLLNVAALKIVQKYREQYD